jgi:hypothetical protein
VVPFDPTALSEDSAGEGHLDQTPLYDVLLKIRDTTMTGRLTIPAAAGENHMFFMRGQPVGVKLAEYFHPLGQLLLEIGRIDARMFIRAQRLIAEGGRLPGQVFKELGVLDDSSLKEVLSLQSRKKAEEFCRLGGRPFIFGRGLTFLSGFSSTPLDIAAVLFIAIKQQMGPASRSAFLDELSGKEVRIPEGVAPLPSPIEVFGFGPAEERFLARLAGAWQKTDSLIETGALPSEEAAVLLRFLQLISRLQVRDIKAAPPPRPAPAPVDDVFAMPVAAAKIPDLSSLPDRSAAHGAGKPDTERTDPKRRVPSIHDVPTDMGNPLSAPTPPMATRPTPSVIVAPELLDEPPKPKKKKVRRTEPLPSTGVVAESETRREKTNIAPMPTIVIDED